MTVTEIEAFTPPVIPSKYDVIPIHSSDRGTFKMCRRRWDWSSPARHNLVLRADLHGVSLPLWFGTGIHFALEQYYNPLLKRDPVESFKTWFDVQWRGGIVTEEWAALSADPKPQPIITHEIDRTPLGIESLGKQLPTTWRVRGLEDIIPDADHEEFDEHYELGINMMMFYRDYAERNDSDIRILMVEHDFSVPVWDYENDCILTAIDTREQSPNYGKRLEVHARGRQDAIYQRISNLRLGIMDHKTAAAIGEDYFQKLETDEQCTNYLAVAQVEANYYGLPWKGIPLEEVIYNVLRKAYPKPPTILKNGMFSISRTDESTTYDMLQRWIAQNLPGVTFTEKQQAYIDYLKDVGDEQFIVRKSVRRGQPWLRSAMQRLDLEAKDMLDPNIRIYPNITDDWMCRNCQFRAPCLAKEDQADWQQLIADNYLGNKDR